MTHQWYVVHTYSGFEQKAKQAMEERIQSLGKQDCFTEILVPSESVVEMKKGVKRTTSRRFFPGYILVKMDLNNDTWHLVKNTPKVTGFVGSGSNPPAVPEQEVLRITKQIDEGTLRPKLKVEFEKGESVRVVDGPFATFAGIVEDVSPDKGKLKILVSIFGRSTPIELDFIQVEKT
jgi:transcriptional antiterminator NusG